MGVRQLLAWQWSDYPEYHRSRTNLMVHIVAVPSFLFANVWFLVSLGSFAPLSMLVALVLTIASIAVQGKGHGLEEKPPVPFTGPGNAVARIMCEQWVTFPRFVLSGGWARARRGIAA